MHGMFVGEFTPLDAPDLELDLPKEEAASKPEMRSMTTMMRRDLHREMSIMAIDEDTTIQVIFERAVLAYLEKSKPKPAPVQATTPAYREGKVPFTTWVNEAAFRQLKVMAAEEGVTLQDFYAAMLNREFERLGKPQVA